MYIAIITKIILGGLLSFFFFSYILKPIFFLRPVPLPCLEQRRKISKQPWRVFFFQRIYSYLTDEYMFQLPPTLFPIVNVLIHFTEGWKHLMLSNTPGLECVADRSYRAEPQRYLTTGGPTGLL